MDADGAGEDGAPGSVPDCGMDAEGQTERVSQDADGNEDSIRWEEAKEEHRTETANEGGATKRRLMDVALKDLKVGWRVRRGCREEKMGTDDPLR